MVIILLDNVYTYMYMKMRNKLSIYLSKHCGLRMDLSHILDFSTCIVENSSLAVIVLVLLNLLASTKVWVM